MWLSPFERKISFRYLRARREEGFISLIAFFSLTGIALGVGTLIIVLAVMNGVRGEMIKSIIGLEGHVSIYSTSKAIEDYDALGADISKISSVKAVLPKIEGQVMVSHRGISMGAMVSGFRYDDLEQKPLLMQKITKGNLKSFARGEAVLIGSRMAEKMRLRVGDNITLISPEGRSTMIGTVPRVKAYPVGGIFKIGMFAYDNGLVVLPFGQAQTFFKLSSANRDATNMIEVLTDNPENAPALARQISNKLGRDYRVYDWKNSNNHIFQAVAVQRNVMFLILMLIILVASFNIISSLIMLVREKGRDIAILRTMGASRSSIMRIFMVCGASIGMIGTLFGVVLGLVVAFNTNEIQLWLESMMGHKLFADELYFLSHLPAKVDMGEVLMVVVMSLALSFIATLYPARRAAKLDPAEGLRYE